MEKLCFIIDNGQRPGICNSLREGGIEACPVQLEGIPAAWGDIHATVARKLKIGFNLLHLPVIDYSYSFQVPALKKEDPFWDFVIHSGGAEGLLEETKKLRGMHRICERHWCLGYFTGKSGSIEFFDSRLSGFLATSLRGRIFDCNTDRIFIPSGENRTLGEFSDSEYDAWLLVNSRQSPVVKFLDWWNQLR